mgnify:CR=1 FL=1
MNGFMQWFKSSNKMKRWMFLILIGIILMCYGIAETLILKEELEKKFNLPVFLMDERLSTTEAEKVLLLGDTSRKKRKKVIQKI